jgi:hypothetical protein
MKLSDFDVTGKKGNAEGGLIDGYATGGVSELFRERQGFRNAGVVKLAKGASWILKNLRQTYKALMEGKGPFAKLNDLQYESYKWELRAQIKKLERGEAIPSEMLDTMIKDKRFKDLVKTKSTDPELRELEEVLLDHGKAYLNYAKKSKDAADSLAKQFGYGKHAPSEIKKQQIDVLEKFDVTGKKGHAGGGLISREGFHRGSLRHQKQHDYEALEKKGNIFRYLMMAGDRAKRAAPENPVNVFFSKKDEKGNPLWSYNQKTDDFESFMKERFMYGEHKEPIIGLGKSELDKKINNWVKEKFLKLVGKEDVPEEFATGGVSNLFRKK